MVLGIIIAVVAFLLVILLAPKGGGAGGDRTQDVVVTAVDVPAGQQLSEALVKTVKFAPDQVPQGAQTITKEAVGQYAAVALPKNTLLSSANLVANLNKIPAAKKPYLDIPPGQVAIAIPAGGELQAVAGYVQQDDRVDILFNPSSSTHNTWKTTYQNVKIARIGGPAAAGSSASQGSGTGSSYIVYVSLDDAENMTELFSSGNYKLALRSQQDATKNDVASTPGATADGLLAKFNVAK